MIAWVPQETNQSLKPDVRINHLRHLVDSGSTSQSVVTTLLEEHQDGREALLAPQSYNPDFGSAKTDECQKKGQYDRSIAGHGFLKKALRTASTRLHQVLMPQVSSEDFLVPLRDVIDVSGDSRHWDTFWGRISSDFDRSDLKRGTP